MRRITITEDAVRLASSGNAAGRSVICHVRVSWPELRLTEAQILANAAATVNGQPLPFPDPSIFEVELPVVIR